VAPSFISTGARGRGTLAYGAICIALVAACRRLEEDRGTGTAA